VYERRVFDVNGLLLQLATDSAITLETSQLYRTALDRTRLEHEVRIAAEIQQALLPEGERKGLGFEVAAASVPCRAIGGDFFDYFDLPDGAFGFALGDVSGKGPPAALLAAQLQGIFAARSHSDAAPADTITSVNRLLVRRAIESRFATVVYGVLSGDGLLTYCNAGHNPPLLITEDGVHQLTTGGLILGAFREARFEQEERRLRPGDMLVVFSDGVTEAVSADGADFGDERLLTYVKAGRDLSAAALLEQLFHAVREFSAGAEPSDDRTALVLRYTGVERTTAA
jgi:sigma-B regulation protein RsbU (phosphoserine phosphatase)